MRVLVSDRRCMHDVDLERPNVLVDLNKCVGHYVLLHMAFEAVARDIDTRLRSLIKTFNA